MRPPLSRVFVKNDAELTVSLSCPARSKVRNRWRWRWRSVCKILSHVESLGVLTIELFMLSVQWSNVPCCPLIRYSQCLPFHWALIESFAGFLRLAGAIDISALCSLLAITFTQKLMAERTWQNLNHLVWRMQASKYPVLLLLTPDCFSILWTAAGCLIVIVCGNLTSTFCLCLSFRVSARVWLIFLPLFAQLSSKQLPPPPPHPLALPASCLLWLYPHEFVCRKNFGCSCQDSPSIFLITRVMWWIYKFLSLSSISPLSLCVCVPLVCVLGIINSSLSCVVELPSSISLSFRGSPQWNLLKPTLSAISRVRLHMTMAFITIAPIKCSQHMSGWMCAAGAQ